MSANHQKVEALFDAALQFTPQERPAFLDGACGTDAALRRQLEELLQAEAEAGAFLPEAPQEPITIKLDLPEPDHEFLRKALSHLAKLYMRAERKDDALKLLEDWLAWCRQNRGTNHVLTLDAMTSLGQLYSEAGRPEESLKLCEEVLPLSREVRGPEDPSTLGDMTNLAIAYSQTGRLPEAVAMQEQTVAIKRRVLSPRHPFRIIAVRLLATLYRKAGRHADAPPLWEEVVALRRQTDGAEHPKTLAEMHGLAGSHNRAGRPEDALRIWEEVLPLSRKVMGPEHRDTIIVMRNLAQAYMTRRTDARAEPLVTVLLALERTSATNDPARLESYLVDLAELRYRLRQFAGAESAYREIIAGQPPGSELRDTVIGATASLGRLLVDWAWVERATNATAAFAHAREGEGLVRQGIAARSARTNTTPRQLADLQSRLGGAICAVALTDPTLTPAGREPRLIEAETLLQQGHTRMAQDAKTEAKYRRDGVKLLVPPSAPATRWTAGRGILRRAAGAGWDGASTLAFGGGKAQGHPMG